MNEHQRILIFIPAYRCAPQVVRVVGQFRDPAVHRWFDEILVIDNVSPDGTAEAAIGKARELGIGKIGIVRNRENYGLGGSHKAAFEYAIANGFSHVAVLHGDDQGDVRDLVKVLKRKSHEGVDCCLGARFHPASRIEGYSPFRIFGNRIFNQLFSAVTLRRLYDLGSGLNLYRVAPLSSRYWIRFHDNLMFNYCMILAHVQRKDEIKFFPISWREDDQISNVKLLSQARRTMQILARFAVDRKSFVDHDFRERARVRYEFDFIEKSI